MMQEDLKESIELTAKIVSSTIEDPNKMGYVAGPYTGRGLHGKEKVQLELKRYHQLTEVTALLTKRFKAPLISPITQSHHLALVKEAELKGDWDMWKEIDTHFISKSDYILLVTLDGWEQSIGVNAELQLAKDRGIPILTYDYTTREFGHINPFRRMFYTEVK